MSGGSYNYLCWSDTIGELFGKIEELERMRDRLVELGFHDAARETEEVRLVLLATNVRIDAMKSRLSCVWKAVEWKDSCDWGIEEVGKAVAAYRGESK